MNRSIENLLALVVAVAFFLMLVARVVMPVIAASFRCVHNAYVDRQRRRRNRAYRSRMARKRDFRALANGSHGSSSRRPTGIAQYRPLDEPNRLGPAHWIVVAIVICAAAWLLVTKTPIVSMW